MDFIERLFVVSPDGGNGSLELLLILAPILAVLLARSVLKRAGRRPATPGARRRSRSRIDEQPASRLRTSGRTAGAAG